MEKWMRSALVLGSALLLPPAGWGAEAPLPLTGAVVNAQGRIPAGAAVELVSLCDPAIKPLPFSLVPAAAVFQGAAPEPGLWQVVARADGAVAMALDLVPLVEAADLPPLKTSPARLLAVKVEDRSGRPLPGSAVDIAAASAAGTPPGGWKPAPVSAVTDQEGIARLRTASSRLLLTVSAPGLPLAQREIDPAAEPAVTVRLQPGRTWTVAAKDRQGRPLHGVRVMTLDGHALGVTDGEGRLAVPVAMGEALPLRLLSPDGRWAQGVLKASGDGTDRSAVFLLEPPEEIHGQVVESRTRQPVAGALVWVDGPSAAGAPAAVRTGVEGRYSLHLSFGGELRLRAAAAGYLPAEGPGDLPATGGAPDRNAPASLRISLERGRAVFGRVVDSREQPIAGAEVRLLPTAASGVSPLRDARETILSAVTDATGTFRIDRLATGSYELRAGARGFAPTQVRRVGLPPGGGAADLGTFLLEPGIALDGHVVDPDGRPVAEAKVQISPAGGISVWDLPLAGQSPAWETVTGSDGAFSFTGLRSGDTLVLRAIRRSYVTRTLSGIALPAAEPLTVELAPAARLSGTVTRESGDPVAGAKVVVLQRLPSGSRPVSAAESDAQGSFTAEDLAPGPLSLTVMAPDLLPATVDGLELPEGGEIADIEVVLRQGSTVEGTVFTPSGAPAAGAEVILSDDGLTTGLMGRAKTRAGGDGGYRLTGIAEGQHTLLADHPGFRPARRALQVQAGANRLDLRLEQGAEVSGRIVDRDGPVAGAGVRLLPQDSGAAFFPAPQISLSDGTFRFPAVADGRYRLEVEKAGASMSPPSQDLQIAGQPVTGLEIRLERGGAVAGRLRGLGVPDLSRALVRATSPDLPGQRGQVGPDGTYRIEGLAPGAWTVVATLEGGRQAGGIVTLGKGQAEAILDLDLGGGLALSGRVESRDAPVAGAVVLVQGVQGTEGAGGETVTGPDGRFLVEGLRPGSYQITALQTRTGLRLDQRLDLEGDRDIVLSLPETLKP